MSSRSFSLLLVFGAALLLGACETDTASKKAFQPIPSKTVALMKQKGMTRQDPILMRIYKESSELEIWKKNDKGRYAHLKTFEICRFSGTLGPKKVEGDGQSPEGFYAVTPGQMNPKSNYYLSFNLGFPNAYDKALGRTGAHLMVHGDCLSKGCYAMTDVQIAEVYSIAREALNAGQPSFQVQALPFRMTAENLARRRDDPNFGFWKNLKEGADHFELTKLEPKVDVCGKKYVFDAEPKNGVFDPNAACPEYEVNPSIAMAMAGKQRQDEQKFADLVKGGLQTAEAYVPQNGRIRRTLADPIRPPQPVVMVAQAEAEPKSAFALAMNSTGSAVPMPVPSPYASAQAKPQQGKSGTAFAWMREEKTEPARTPQPATTSATPAQSAATTLAMAEARPAAVPGQPVTASLGPTPAKEKPFYKRWMGFGFGGDKSAAPAP